MFQAWRWKIRQADEACANGRLDEAFRLLQEGDLRTYLPGQKLVDRLSGQFVARATTRAAAGDLVGAWRDQEYARALAGGTSEVLSLEAGLIDQEVLLAEEHLEAGRMTEAASRLEDLDRRKIDSESARMLRGVIRRVESARNLVAKGKFSEAESQLLSARTIRPDLACLDQRLAECRQHALRFRELTEQLHAAIAHSAWSKAVPLADEALEIAPESRLARDARQRAWAEVGTHLVDSRAGGSPFRQRGTAAAAQGNSASADRAPRFLLWIDAVGGYLVCLADEIIVGQAIPGNNVDVAILGDLSRRHAKLRRQGEGYVIEPLSAVRVEGKVITKPTLLADGDEVELGRAVRLRFRKPHVLSASARLEFVSCHSTSPSADGVLLMAESCVLGPRWQNHVVCKNWAQDVVLYRQEDSLFCRSMDSIEIDGELCEGRGRVGDNSRIKGTDFSLTLEPV